MRIIFVLISNLIMTLFIELFLLLEDSVPLKEYKKRIKDDIYYMLLIYITLNLGYIINYNIR